MTSRVQALSWFHEALAALAPGRLLRRRLQTAPRLDAYRHIAVLAFGKAAPGMLAAWLQAAPGLGARAGAVEAWLSAPAGAPAPAWPPAVPVHAFIGGHPEPNPASLEAGAAMLAAARALAASAQPALLVALISGGGSALVEATLEAPLPGRQLGDALSASGRPLPASRRHSGAGLPGIEARTPSDHRERPQQKVASHGGLERKQPWCSPSRRSQAAFPSGKAAPALRAAGHSDAVLALAEAQTLHRALVASGAPIGEINCIRKRWSAFKGGRLAAAAAGPHVDQVSWILSDVAGDDWASVASGPTFPEASTAADYEAAWRRWLPDLPCPPAPPAPPPGDAVFARSQWHCLASNRDATTQLAGLAAAAGYAPVVVDTDADEAEEPMAAEQLAARWRALRAAHPRPALIAGGEVRVRLPAAHGRGGRNQLLALRIATWLEGEPFVFLSAGTDGVDGSSPAAGALVDGHTLARARAAGLDPARHLAAFDPHPLLAATGDLVLTGPTGNNLRDLRLFLPA